MSGPTAETPEQQRFLEVFRHLAAVTAYARRRGAPDPEAVASETMTVAWRRLDAIPLADPLPWLLATARNLVLAQFRATTRHAVADDRDDAFFEPRLEPGGLSPELEAALRRLAPIDREALLLIAWEDLTPAQAARAQGVSPVVFRVRLHRARRRCAALLAIADAPPMAHPEVSNGC
jgi:DNA-directed RNA polymerase specialized sigma24 family protein